MGLGVVILMMAAALIIVVILLTSGVSLWIVALVLTLSGIGVVLLLWVVDWATKDRGP